MKTSAALRATLAVSLSVTLPLASLAACSSNEGSPATPATKLSERYLGLGANLGRALARLKSSAVSASTIAPADFGSVAPIPKNLTGGVDLAAEQTGKLGEKAADIDESGSEETVAIFVPDAPTSGTAATLPSFAAWAGDAKSNDAGLCYLAWTKGASWFVASKCGDSSGAWVCQVTSEEAVCNACNTAGDCAPCDLEQSSFSCTWP